MMSVLRYIEQLTINRQWTNQKYNVDIIYIGIVFIRLDVVEHIDFQ